MTRRKSLLAIAGAAALATAAAGFAFVAPGADAVVKRPYDISWPQCQPGGQPMPDPAATSLVIIGLTRGRPFVENPCVADQYAWATTNGIQAQAYTMLKWPQADQITTYKAAGPWSAATSIGQLRNVGYAQGKASVATLARLGWRPKVVWVDVEQPSSPANIQWPEATTRALADRNRAVVEGAIRGLEDSGYPVGIYSTKNQWPRIVGSWWLPAYPAWVATGQTNDTVATNACSAGSFSGGRVFLTQWTDLTYDFDVKCPAWVDAPAKPPAPSWGNDVNADWKNDLLARQASNGQLWLYKGTGARTGAGVFQPRVAVGTFGSSYNLLETVGDLTGDGRVDLLARDTGGGLWLFPGTGGTTWGARQSLGRGWSAMKSITGIGDWTGDGRPDVAALESATGYLYVYPGRGTGTLAARTLVMRGLGGMDRIVGVGDMTLNGIPDLVTREASSGRLFLYPGFANGAFGTRVSIGSGWNTMGLLAGVGDFNADGVPDLMARQTAAAGGALYLYPGTTAGTFSVRLKVGTGWTGMNAIA